MIGICAWCGKQMQRDLPAESSGVTHGMCEECFLNLRVQETLKRLESGKGPYMLFVPPMREDLVLRLWREAPPGCFLIFHGDRRTRQVLSPAAGWAGPERRRPSLSFLASAAPAAPSSP